MTYNDILVNALFPQQEAKNDGKITVSNLLPKAKSIKGQFPLESILSSRLELNNMLIQFNDNISGDEDSGVGYEKYLQVGAKPIKELSQQIIRESGARTNDEKMYAIEQWVANNIEYKLDEVNYGQSEFWAYPTLTMRKGSGDCEDGAFLTHSLAIASGIPYDRLRTYGGFVEVSEGTAVLGGHAWTAYKRESDDEWITTDWCYYPTDESISTRTPMKYDKKYWDDFFYVDATKTVNAVLINRIRKPSGVGITSGSIINGYA